MSDQKTTAGDGIHQSHWCEHAGCKDWGGFGFSRSKADKPIWHCWEQYPHKVPIKVS